MSMGVDDRGSIAHTSNLPLNSLTSLRFFAALAVIFYHSGAGFVASSRAAPPFVQTLLNNGWLGVPFFFILSGFILSYAHNNIHFDQRELLQFLVARFSRIYPVYILALVMSVPYVDHFSLATDWFQFFLLQSWFPGTGAADWNFVAWTLSVELFFYLLFPFVFISIRTLSNRALMAGLTVTIGVLLMIWLNMTPRLGGGELRVFDVVFHLPVPVLRTPEFVYGMFLGVVFLRGIFTKATITAYAAICVIVIAATMSNNVISQTIVLIAFGPIIISFATLSRRNIIRRILENPFLVLLGGASYALYLLQFPVRKFMGVLVPEKLELYGRIAFAPALICFSIWVFLRYEGPMRKRLRRALDPSAKIQSRSAMGT